MGEILKWLLVVAACGGLFFASFVTIRYLGQKLKEEEEKEETEDNSKAVPAKQEENGEYKDEISIADVEPSEEEKKADEAPAEEISDIAESPAEPEAEDSDEDEEDEETDYVMSDFDKNLIDFLENEGYQNKNYMISPVSLRAVLGLAVAGAANDTKSELLKASGFTDDADMNKWYEGVANAPDTSNGDVTFKLLNSAWHNTSMPGTLSPDYINYIKDHYNAEASDVAPEEMTNAINTWVNDGTNGLIPNIADDFTDEDMVLVNTLYLKAPWLSTFDNAATEEGDFKAYDECSIKKEFMDQTGHFRFYEDEKTKILSMPMGGDVVAVYVLGDPGSFQDKLAKAADAKVHVKIPKFVTETSLDNNELVKYLQSRGAKNAFVPGADFSAMSNGAGFYISDIIQKTKIITDENGIEAAAASGIAILGSAPPSLQEEIKEFIADEPFKYYILTSGSVKEILFYGQIVE
ncbi:serpin family protein [Butyrivibrio sp. JL13D10]|uniref:serpin family protein n=1 Tax=Butyrivibrio sp. JL13D10 TaxID=3236815 RepID=UPI0038B443AB